MNSSKEISGANEISLKNIAVFVDFLHKSSGRHFVTVLGGEPTLHSRFEELIEYMGKKGIVIQLTTNGIINDTERLVFIKKTPFIQKVSVNLRLPEDYQKKEWERINSTLFVLSNKCFLGHRIYTKDFHLSEFFGLIRKFNLRKSLELAPACPTVIGNNTYLSLSDFKTIARKLVIYSRESLKCNIEWYTDVGFHLCTFTFKQLGELYANTNLNLFLNCPPALEVDINLGVHRCFGTAGHSYFRPYHLNEFRNVQEILETYNAITAKVKRIGVFKECKSCKFFARCGGGCVARTLLRSGKRSEIYRNTNFGPSADR